MNRKSKKLSYKLPRVPARSNGLHPGGRPRLALTDYQKTFIAEKAQEGNSKENIARLLGIDDTTLENCDEFQAIYTKNLAVCKAKLWHRQLDRALNPDNSYPDTMLVWLGKQYLGQSDRSEHSGEAPKITIVLEAAPNQPDPRIVEAEVKELPPATSESDSSST